MNRLLLLFARKEWRDLRHDSRVLPGYLLLPIILTAIPVIMLAVMPTDLERAAADPDFRFLVRLATSDPAFARYPVEQRMVRLMIREFGALFLIMPFILASTSAALSIAAEKQQRTLEPILATPISDRDLLLAKLMAALAPATATTWLTALLYAGGVAVVTATRFGEPFFPGFPFWVSTGLVAPVVGAAAALGAIRTSIRSNDVQSAIQVAGLVVIPAGMVFAAALGRPAQRSVTAGLVSAVVAGLVGWWLLRMNLKRLEREEILTRWT